MNEVNKKSKKPTHRPKSSHKFKKGVRQVINGIDTIITVVRIGNIKMAIKNEVFVKIQAPTNPKKR